MEVLRKVKIVILDVDIWTGRRSLIESDLKLAAGSKLPPASLASLGSKLIMDPEKLAVFHNKKMEAVRILLSVGTRFLGAYAIPDEKIDWVMEKLNAIEEAFNLKKKEFGDEFQSSLNMWMAANPGWEEIIKTSAITAEAAVAKLKFTTQVITVSAVEGQEKGLRKEVDGLADQLRQEVQAMAQATYKISFCGKTEVTQKAVRPLRAMLTKIEGLMFLEPSLEDLVLGLKDTLAELPSKGVIKGRDLASACGILAILGNIPEAVSQGKITVEAVEAESKDSEIEITKPFVKPAEQSTWF